MQPSASIGCKTTVRGTQFQRGRSRDRQLPARAPAHGQLRARAGQQRARGVVPHCILHRACVVHQDAVGNENQQVGVLVSHGSDLPAVRSQTLTPLSQRQRRVVRLPLRRKHRGCSGSCLCDLAEHENVSVIINKTAAFEIATITRCGAHRGRFRMFAETPPPDHAQEKPSLCCSPSHS